MPLFERSAFLLRVSGWIILENPEMCPYVSLPGLVAFCRPGLRRLQNASFPSLALPSVFFCYQVFVYVMFIRVAALLRCWCLKLAGHVSTRQGGIAARVFA